MKTRRTETQLRSEPRESAELKVLRRSKVKGFKAKADSAHYHPPGPRKKRHKIDVLSEEARLPMLPALVERDPMIRVYSEDSAYVDTQLVTENNRISFRMESQDTELTELRLSSFYSQDEILNQSRTREPQSEFDRSKAVVTMSSLASTEFDPQFRSEDCLVRYNHSVPDKSITRYSICCYNFVVEFIRALLISDYPASKGEVKERMPALEVTSSYSLAPPALMTSWRGEGRVTTGCLWHACRAVTIGLALIITGISLTVIGYLSDQREYKEHLEMSRKFDNYTSSKFKEGRLHLSNVSFSGPVVLGTGGFLVIVACVMTLEARDNAAKIVPATACLDSARSQCGGAGSGPGRARDKPGKFKSSASQTALRDRDIVAVLTGSSNTASQPASRQRSLERERRFSSGSSTGGVGGQCTDRARQDRTMAFVNGESEGDSLHKSLHKCPSAPCIPSQHSRAEVTTVRYCDETNSNNNNNNNNSHTAVTDKW